MDTNRYAKLNGISSVDKGLMLSDVMPLILPKRAKDREPRLANLAAVESIYWKYQSSPIRLKFTVEGTDKADLVNKLQSVAGWILNASELCLWYDPAKYYTGSVEGDTDFNLITSNYGTLEFDFLCNPPCWHKVNSKTAGWLPVAGTPAPEQITAGTETASRVNAGNLPSVTYTAAHPAALFFAIIGTWDSLALGGAAGLVINWPTPQSLTLYIDCDAQVVYHKLGGVMTAVPFSGDFPVLAATGAMAVAGTNLDATIRMLVIERG